MAVKPRRPNLVLEDYFAGQTNGWGVTQGRRGTLKNQFTISAQGLWDADRRILQLTETYVFDDGHVDVVNWKIVREAEQHYVGQEPTLVGKAEGEQRSNWFRWRYRRNVPGKGGSSAKLGFDDCFWLQEDGVLIARASITKLGIEVASMSVFYRKV